jgi:hypothetical protein
MNRRFRSFVILVGMVLVSAPTQRTTAQPFWMPRGEEKTAVMFEFLRPNIENIDGSLLSSAYFLSGRVTLSSGLRLVGELPYANYKATFEGTDLFGNPITIEESGSTIGNPYLGLEVSPSDSPIFVELGVRPPVADEDETDARGIGLASDATRWEAFLPKAVFVQGAFNVREVTESKVEYRMRLSPVLLISTDDAFYSDGAELFGVYAWSIGYHGEKLRVGSGLSGRVLLTEDFGNLGTRSVNQFDLHADIGDWSLRPGFDLHVPVGNLADLVPVVVGVNVSWSH